MLQPPGQTEAWIVAARRGDRLALAKLLTTYHPRLRARATAGLEPALRTRISPEDILQDAYLDVAHQIARFRPRGPGSFLGWVCSILDHKLLDARRAAHRLRRDVGREVTVATGGDDSYWNLLDSLCVETGTPSRVVRRQETLAAMMRCLSGLPEVHRRVVRLRFLEGLSVAEVAARLGRTQGAVVALCQRALSSLRYSMEGLGEFTRGG